jgi:hypothetical protein
VQEERPRAICVRIRRIDRGGEIGAAFDDPRAEVANALRFDAIGIGGQKDRRGNAGEATGVGDRRAVIPGARCDDLADRSPRGVHRQRVQRAADLERCGRQPGFDFQVDFVSRQRQRSRAGQRRREGDGGGQRRREQPPRGVGVTSG